MDLDVSPVKKNTKKIAEGTSKHYHGISNTQLVGRTLLEQAEQGER
jgi:hypothetical protein